MPSAPPSRPRPDCFTPPNGAVLCGVGDAHGVRFLVEWDDWAHLQLSEFEDEPLDSFLLVHLIKIIEVTVDRLLDAADRRAQTSATH